MRRRGAYLWRMIARGAVKTTPRTWLTHVALVAVDEAAPPPLALPTISGRCAVERVENVHVPRRELAVTGRLTADTLVTIAPLHQVAGADAQFWTVDPANPVQLRSLTVRRVPLLTAIVEALDGGVRTMAGLHAALLAADPTTAPAWELLAAFVGRLAMLGVIEPSTPPRRNCPVWEDVAAPGGQERLISATPRVPPGVPGEDHYLDVYRGAGAAVSGAACLVVEEAVRQVLRLSGLLDLQHPRQPPAFLSRLDAEPRPVLDVLSERLTEVAAKQRVESAHGPATSRAGPENSGNEVADHPSTGWRPPIDGSAYHRLVSWIDDHAALSPGGPTVRLTAAVLDAVGAPEVDLVWPMDCTVRPIGSGREGVLDVLTPAGALDARFGQALEALHGPLPHVAAYRNFLAELDERTGVASVELMIPPLRDAAANAVRRPGYTATWTGDADLSAYCVPSPDDPRRFIPLSGLTVRRDGDSVVVEADGKPVRILYHSMRSAPWPWSLLQDLLMADSEQYARLAPRWRCPLVAMPHRGFLPRLAIGDFLVLAPAHWRVKSGRFWDAASIGELEKARRLVRLREEAGLPRFVVVYSRGPRRRPYPCDLESLAAIDVFERALTPATEPADPTLDVYVEEMLPAPAEMPARDLAHQPGGRSAAEVMLRMPHRASPAELANLAAREYSARLVACRTQATP
jgi:hypothetical protein